MYSILPSKRGLKFCYHKFIHLKTLVSRKMIIITTAHINVLFIQICTFSYSYVYNLTVVHYTFIKK